MIKLFKKQSKGVRRLILALSFPVSVFIAILTIGFKKSIGDIWGLLGISMFFMLIYFIFVAIILWVIDGFKEE